MVKQQAGGKEVPIYPAPLVFAAIVIAASKSCWWNCGDIPPLTDHILLSPAYPRNRSNYACIDTLMPYSLRSMRGRSTGDGRDVTRHRFGQIHTSRKIRMSWNVLDVIDIVAWKERNT